MSKLTPEQIREIIKESEETIQEVTRSYLKSSNDILIERAKEHIESQDFTQTLIKEIISPSKSNGINQDGRGSFLKILDKLEDKLSKAGKELPILTKWLSGVLTSLIVFGLITCISIWYLDIDELKKDYKKTFNLRSLDKIEKVIDGFVKVSHDYRYIAHDALNDVLERNLTANTVILYEGTRYDEYLNIRRKLLNMFDDSDSASILALIEKSYSLSKYSHDSIFKKAKNFIKNTPPPHDTLSADNLAIFNKYFNAKKNKFTSDFDSVMVEFRAVNIKISSALNKTFKKRWESLITSGE